MTAFKAAANPQAFVQDMLTNNPNANAIMQLVSNSGGDPRAAFYTLARQKGVDPEQFLSYLQ